LRDSAAAVVAPPALRRWVKAGAVNGNGELYAKSSDQGICCLRCLERRKLKCIFYCGTSGLANIRRHFQAELHADDADIKDALSTATAAPAARSTGAASSQSVPAPATKGSIKAHFPPAAPPPKDRTATVIYTEEQQRNVYVAALLASGIAPHAAASPAMRAWYLTVTGSLPFSPPSHYTVKKIEEELYEQCVDNFREKLVEHGVGTFENGIFLFTFPPRLSLSFDGSTAQTKSGLSTISVILYWLNPRDFSKQSFVLGMGTFSLPKTLLPVGETVTRGTGKNIALKVVQLLKDVRLMDQDTVYATGMCSKVFFVAATDNASNEVNAVETELGITRQADPPHSLQLVVKHGLAAASKPPPADPAAAAALAAALSDAAAADSASDGSSSEEEEEEAAAPGRAARQSKHLKGSILWARQLLSRTTKGGKLGNGTALFLQSQAADGVEQPRGLVTHVETRCASMCRHRAPPH
jgi:hypothetical protein